MESLMKLVEDMQGVSPKRELSVKLVIRMILI